MNGPGEPGFCGCRSQPPKDEWRSCAGYADIGISGIMPTPGLCRLLLIVFPI
ncbi:MAG: hypothetical protein KJO26_12780 [Deltaproteobacteria bacterium]|nr:hypothetical protein [Deltaproteobacteria bacterium]